MSTEAKEPGQRAYEAYHGVLRNQRWWHAEGSEDRKAWAAVERACAVPAATQGGKAPDDRDADGYRVVWDWAPFARFIGARAQCIHEAVADGKSFAQIRDWLSMDEMQVQLISMTDISQIHGIPGNVWPPKKFQTPEPAAAGADKAQARWHRIPELPLSKAEGAESDLPDSDTLVELINRDSGWWSLEVGQLEFTDDSEGHGEPHWDTSLGDQALDAFTHWRPLGDLPPPPSAPEGA